MTELLTKLVIGETIIDEDIHNALTQQCEDIHSSCHSDCPVYAINNEMPLNDKNNSSCFKCSCFKDGKKMADFIKQNVKSY